MIKHPDYWFQDGSAVLCVGDAAYRLYSSLIIRLSPQFFSKCCQTSETPDDIIADTGSLPCYSIRSDIGISRDDFEALIAYILHDVSSTEEVPFSHFLRLFIVTSAAKGDFPKIHRAEEKQLIAYLLQNPLDIDFGDYQLLEEAFYVANRSENIRLKTLLKRALYYSTTTQEVDAHDGAKPTDADSAVTDPAIVERLMSNLADVFAPTLFQPPAALHMECTDVFASLWMERAVQPAFTHDATANPFWMLRRIRALDWKRESDEARGDRSQPCIDCLEHLRNEWSAAAQAMWENIDVWIAE